jgi:hypothetical protein
MNPAVTIGPLCGWVQRHSADVLRLVSCSSRRKGGQAQVAQLPHFVFSPNTFVSLIGLMRGPDTTRPTPQEDWREATVDVVIPAFNDQHNIVRCLASVMRQTLRPRRIVLVDDGSSDTTAERARSFCEFHGVELAVVQRRTSIAKTTTIKEQTRARIRSIPKQVADTSLSRRRPRRAPENQNQDLSDTMRGVATRRSPNAMRSSRICGCDADLDHAVGSCDEFRCNVGMAIAQTGWSGCARLFGRARSLRETLPAPSSRSPSPAKPPSRRSYQATRNLPRLGRR